MQTKRTLIDSTTWSCHLLNIRERRRTELRKSKEMTRSLVQGGESMLVDETDAQGPGRQLVQVVHAECPRTARSAEDGC